MDLEKKKSGTTVLTEIIELIVEALDETEEIMLTCLDLSRAFDCVNYKVLIEKLEYYGIRKPMLVLLRLYLKNRYQVVKCKNKQSTKKTK